MSTRCFWLTLLTLLVRPDGVRCTQQGMDTIAGNPNLTAATACYPGPSTLISGTPTHFTSCPAGYTTATSTSINIFNAKPAPSPWPRRA